MKDIAQIWIEKNRNEEARDILEAALRAR
jgi:hypothetical protein